MGRLFWGLRQFLLLIKMFAGRPAKLAGGAPRNEGASRVAAKREQALAADRALESASAQWRESAVEAEKQFAITFAGKVDQCYLLPLFGADFTPAGPLLNCKVSDPVCAVPAADGTLDLFLADTESRLGSLASSRAADIRREILGNDRTWIGFIFVVTEATAKVPGLVSVMMYRLTTAYCSELIPKV
jgi:hypothetical protein